MPSWGGSFSGFQARREGGEFETDPVVVMWIVVQRGLDG
jgi:hypothetical protein